MSGLWWAVRKKDYNSVLSQLQQNNNKVPQSCMDLAVTQNDLQTVTLFIQHGAKIEKLHPFFRQPSLEMQELLLQNGTKLDPYCFRYLCENTWDDYTKGDNKNQLLRLYLKYDPHKSTALYGELASKSKNMEIIKLLIEHDAVLKDNEVLWRVHKANRLDIVHLILKKRMYFPYVIETSDSDLQKQSLENDIQVLSILLQIPRLTCYFACIENVEYFDEKESFVQF